MFSGTYPAFRFAAPVGRFNAKLLKSRLFLGTSSSQPRRTTRGVCTNWARTEIEQLVARYAPIDPAVFDAVGGRWWPR
jgi:hypothetical protein